MSICSFTGIIENFGFYIIAKYPPGGLRYLGFLYPDGITDIVYVWNANPGAVALPESIHDDGWTSGPRREAFVHTRTHDGAISDDPVLRASTSVVSIVPEQFIDEAALHLRYFVDDGVYEENMWFVDEVEVADAPGHPTRGLRRQNVLHAGVVSLDITYARWERR